MESDKLWKILDSVQAHIRVFDAKAQIVIAVDGVLAGFFGSQTVKIAELIALQRPPSALSLTLAVVGVTCVVALGSSLMFAVFTVYPRLHLKQPDSRIFFAHICRQFGRDYAKGAAAFASLNEEELAADLSNQIVANSIICSTKAQRFRNGLLLMSSAVLLWIVTLFFQFAVQHSVTRSASPAPPCSITAGTTAERQAPAVQNVYVGGGSERPRKDRR
jgi:hypothetical protein